VRLAVQKIKEVIPKLSPYVSKRIEEFRRLGKEGRTRYDFRPFLSLEFEAGTFSELCFCLLTANSSAVMGIKIQAELGDEGFMHLGFEEMVEAIRKHGHRFPEQRAERIIWAREVWRDVEKIVRSDVDSKSLRDLLTDPDSKFKVKGFGYKEASHFLRNLGREDVAIIDRHVYRFLTENGLLPEVKTLTPKRYLEAEEVLGEICRELGITQAELDLYIFYIKTGKVLK